MDEILSYNVSSIKLDGAVTIDYSYEKMNAQGKSVKVKLHERPHQDFMAALDDIKECFCQMIVLPLADPGTGQKLEPIIEKINLVYSSKYGYGMKITAAVYGIEYHDSPTMLTTLPYYKTGLRQISEVIINGCKIARYTQQLSPAQLDAMERMKREAFAFAFYNKKEQPTLEEATAEYIEQGRLIDE